MWQSWLQIAGDRFAESVKSILNKCNMSSAFTAYGDEDTQCQHFLTNLFLALRAQERSLSQMLIADSQIPDLMVEFRYYCSRRNRIRPDAQIQFAQSKTGAEFALGLLIDLKNIAYIERYVFAHVRLIESGMLGVDCDEMRFLEKSKGGELGLYAVWGDHNPPFVLTIANMKSIIRATGKRPRVSDLEKFGRQLADYVVEDFLGLWHGVDFYPQEFGEIAPEGSMPILHHMLHLSEPPANVVFFGVHSAESVGFEPGFYVLMDLPEETSMPDKASSVRT